MIRADVAVVGGGPSGSYAAYRLASMGYQVVVVEEHPRVGEPENCAGLIGTEAFEEFDLPRETIIRGFDSATFFSPDGTPGAVGADRTVAYVVKRCAFDRGLAAQAEKAGASYLLGRRCTEIRHDCNGVTLTLAELGSPTFNVHGSTSGDPRPVHGSRFTVHGGSNVSQLVDRSPDPSRSDIQRLMSDHRPPTTDHQALATIRTKAVIIATGVRYQLLDRLQASRPGQFMDAAHVETRMRDVERVEVYLGGSLFHGGFGWAIPGAGDSVRLGLCNGSYAAKRMTEFYTHPLVQGRLLESPGKIKSKRIPIEASTRTFGDRLLIVGDAAGQVKPTTGGGIHYGILCGNLAAETLHEAFQQGDLTADSLSSYERRWRRKLALELRVGRFFRRVGLRLDDVQLDRLVRAYDDAEVRDLVRRTAKFERHKDFILALCRSRVFWGLVWRSVSAW